MMPTYWQRWGSWQFYVGSFQTAVRYGGMAETLIGITAFLLGIILKDWLPAYAKKKGENLATKEDIGEITKAVKSVEQKFTDKTKILESSLDRSNQLDMKLFEKEWEMYQQIWKAISSWCEFMTTMESQRIQEKPLEFDSEKSRVHAKETLKEAKKLAYLTTHNTPFLPDVVKKPVAEFMENTTELSNLYFRVFENKGNSIPEEEHRPAVNTFNQSKSNVEKAITARIQSFRKGSSIPDPPSE